MLLRRILVNVASLLTFSLLPNLAAELSRIDTVGRQTTPTWGFPHISASIPVSPSIVSTSSFV
jgi:hypothetical protein